MRRKLTQEEAEAKNLSVGIKMIGKYINSHIPTEFECPYCKKVFICVPSNIWNKHTGSCGCYQKNLAAKMGKNKNYHKKISIKLQIPKTGNSLAEKCPDSLKYWDYEKNNKTPHQINYGSNNKYWMKCNYNNNHSYLISCKYFTKGERCPYCSNNNSKTLIGFNDLLTNFPKLCQEWDYIKNKNKPDRFTCNSNKYVWWICKLCGYNWKTRIHLRTKTKCGCPKCCESKGEKEIAEILDKYNIKYEREKRFLYCRNKRPLPFDFWLPDYGLLIEYQGEQHFEEVNYFGKTPIKQRKTHDIIKREFAKKYYKYLEISYKNFNNIENILKEYI
jgi:hypothetical protein